MTRGAFERDLRQLNEGVVRMGERAGEAIHGAVEALRARDVAAAERIIAEDDAIDALHMDLEQRCMRLLATQQPMAGDLRTIASVFAITIDLERMAEVVVEDPCDLRRRLAVLVRRRYRRAADQCEARELAVCCLRRVVGRARAAA